MSTPVSIHWFRQDLRLADNPALTQAAECGKVLPVYILDDENAAQHQMGSASRWWLHHSLQALNESLSGKLCVYKGDPETILSDLAQQHCVQSIHWNRCYEPWRIARDKKIKETLEAQGIETKTHNGSLLWEPWEIHKADGTPYKVFTPFYRRGCLNATPPRQPLPTPTPLELYENAANSRSIDLLDLLPKIRWDTPLEPHWNIGETGAVDRVYAFFEEGLHHYKEGRNIPAKPYVSRLSPHLHFGEISPNQVWHSAIARGEDTNIDHFCSELGWREFSYSQLYYNPELPRKNLQSKFDIFPWIEDAETLHAWQKGQTGIPIVDAGMRELWQTGVMHNRVRMIVGSFLVKNLLLHWHHGEHWFWDCLVDADLASNSASWQWIAGCGADAAPFFRIFNPVTQGKRFDPQGEYTRQFVPELRELPDKYLFNPWEAPDTVLQGASVTLGKTYPNPIVDLKTSRNRALEAFKSLKPIAN
ncbi:MAG: deoxyribodipyrimidine photo-lyase [Rickettsiales bacterium]|nr:deoxyribodipyrimidine photo-lyase [Rickettsiales bacterium]